MKKAQLERDGQAQLTWLKKKMDLKKCYSNIYGCPQTQTGNENKKKSYIDERPQCNCSIPSWENILAKGFLEYNYFKRDELVNKDCVQCSQKDKRIKELENEIAILRAKLKICDDKNEENKSEIKRLESQKEQLKNKLLSEWQLKINNLEKEKQKEITKLNNTITVLKAQKDQVTEDYNALSALNNENIDIAEETFLNYKKEIQDYTNKLESKTKEIARVNEQNRKLNNLFSSKNNNDVINEYKKQISEMEETNSSLLKEIDDKTLEYEENIIDRDDTIIKLELSKNNFISKIKKLEEKIDNNDMEYERELENKQNENQQLAQSIMAIKIQLQAERVNADNKEELYNREIQYKENLINYINETYNQLNQAYQEQFEYKNNLINELYIAKELQTALINEIEQEKTKLNLQAVQFQLEREQLISDSNKLRKEDLEHQQQKVEREKYLKAQRNTMKREQNMLAAQRKEEFLSQKIMDENYLYTKELENNDDLLTNEQFDIENQYYSEISQKPIRPMEDFFPKNETPAPENEKPVAKAVLLTSLKEDLLKETNETINTITDIIKDVEEGDIIDEVAEKNMSLRERAKEKYFRKRKYNVRRILEKNAILNQEIKLTSDLFEIHHERFEEQQEIVKRRRVETPQNEYNRLSAIESYYQSRDERLYKYGEIDSNFGREVTEYQQPIFDNPFI
jgi:hypothetical protein